VTDEDDDKVGQVLLRFHICSFPAHYKENCAC